MTRPPPDPDDTPAAPGYVDVGSDLIYGAVGYGDDEDRDGVWMRRLGADDTDCGACDDVPATWAEIGRWMVGEGTEPA